MCAAFALLRSICRNRVIPQARKGSASNQGRCDCPKERAIISTTGALSQSHVSAQRSRWFLLTLQRNVKSLQRHVENSCQKPSKNTFVWPRNKGPSKIHEFGSWLAENAPPRRALAFEE